MIIITGAAGMIGSVTAWHLNNNLGENDLILCDDLAYENQEKNLSKRKYLDFVKKDQLLTSLSQIDAKKIDAIIHMGAISATTEKIFSKLIKDNIRFSQKLWSYCTEKKIPFIYASSAATYGDGSQGYDDEIHSGLKPLNAYGYSKYFFDRWALDMAKKNECPPYWAGCKFFNVYGPNEYHKGRMASVVYHAFNQINNEGLIKLFKSNKPQYEDGGQLRDFIYVKDAVSAMIHLLNTKKINGLFNIGTGKAQTFFELAKSLVKNHQASIEQIQFIDMPSDLDGKYQYFTEAKIDKLFKSGYDLTFNDLDSGVSDYYQNYLSQKDQYL
jgi:ADP-L-glycero-D-manno-heptose 6-epimerase